MKYPQPLQSATLIKRYKRFLADVTLDNGDVMTLHCANTGAMTGCAEPGDTVWYSTSNNPKRKYPCSWELTQTRDGHFIGINTATANTLAAEAIEQGVLDALGGYDRIQREVRYGEENSRIDLLLSGNHNPLCYVEVKSCTLLQQQQGYFPDAVTTRGQKHLRELMQMVDQGHRAVLLFLVQHSGIDSVSPADHIDPAYATLCREAMDKGVEFLAVGTEISPQGITVMGSLPVKPRV
ncbi:sugar fermentation stimulation protein A [Ferrimonas sediminum]|uniref:Sugar fermentation stimulation protein homolog n=1 Tax=Ferrimonas sediminum TaxID=718193 RepID=A0A1G8M8H4_9GAMM|nr:DNA/RNA nuclease SfsA [Ferrimonas sediminum]SDI64228.1 sugar fermentation stimulation protein A [Ferrimonas sediminum]